MSFVYVLETLTICFWFSEDRIREGIDQNTPVRMRGRNPRLYDDPYDEGGAPAGGPQPGVSGDRRPKEDYDEPWEWANKQSMLLKTELESGGHNLPPHFITKQTPQTSTPLVKRTVEAKPAAAAATENQEEEEEEGEPDFIETVDTEAEQPSEGTEKEKTEKESEEKAEEKAESTEVKEVKEVKEEITKKKEESTEAEKEKKDEKPEEKDAKKEEEKTEKEKTESKEGETKAEAKDEEEGAVGGAAAEEEAVVHVVDEDYNYEYEVSGLKKSSSYEKTRRESDEENEHEGYTHLTASEAEGESTLGDTLSSVTGEESTPASTSTAATGNYEEPWDLTSKQREIEDKLKAVSDRASRELNAKSKVPAPHESDTRSQEGYEKPWDWKPHQKDDRSQEGYEKPWDWKPHQKDDRPTEEYEEPWDQKAKGLGRDLLSPKTSNPPSGPGSKGDPLKEQDTRPPEEYDEPWENKMKKSSSSPKAGTY